MPLQRRHLQHPPVLHGQGGRCVHLESLASRPAPLPDISAEEKKLPKKTRTTLAQLRSGFSRMLNNYINSIDPNINDQCPDHMTRNTCLRVPATQQTLRWGPSGQTPLAWPDFSGWTWTTTSDSGYYNNNNNHNPPHHLP